MLGRGDGARANPGGKTHQGDLRHPLHLRAPEDGQCGAEGAVDGPVVVKLLDIERSAHEICAKFLPQSHLKHSVMERR